MEPSGEVPCSETNKGRRSQRRAHQRVLEREGGAQHAFGRGQRLSRLTAVPARVRVFARRPIVHLERPLCAPPASRTRAYRRAAASRARVTCRLSAFATRRGFPRGAARLPPRARSSRRLQRGAFLGEITLRLGAVRAELVLLAQFHARTARMDRPMAIACFVDRAPCFSFTNVVNLLAHELAACVDAVTLRRVCAHVRSFRVRQTLRLCRRRRGLTESGSAARDVLRALARAA